MHVGQFKCEMFSGRSFLTLILHRWKNPYCAKTRISREEKNVHELLKKTMAQYVPFNIDYRTEIGRESNVKLKTLIWFLKLMYQIRYQLITWGNVWMCEECKCYIKGISRILLFVRGECQVLLFVFNVRDPSIANRITNTAWK